ncbi:transketolase [Actinomadura sp. CNU-125]|uniref:transketolase family protein n=1 Tax=Actinomadura sp. CNU-125 TaxID=1904961 RepID=UPI00095D153F|nr:transketolase C-terminal domain-containing protein [Actinomadura sp. CNU-125]OLT23241.1 transketolase [Actinomadura sp. CNU-125]
MTADATGRADRANGARGARPDERPGEGRAPAVRPRSAREAYRDLLPGLMLADERLYCLDSDTGLFDRDAFAAVSGRYLNLGIAEHNLMGTAAGLAASGRMPFVTTMATFAATRALEFIKIDIAYNALPVRIVATHGGLAAGHLGPTHHALEDLGIMRMLPGFTVVVPADARQAEEAVRQSLALPGPVYIRLGRGATPDLDGGRPAAAPFEIAPFEIGRAQWLRPPGDVAIIACGPHPVLAALRAADLLDARGVRAAVLNVHTPHPLDADAVLAAAAGTRGVVTVEEHWRTGGLGGAVAETLAERAPVRVARIGMPATFAERAGDQEHLLDRYGITADAAVAAALKLFGGTHGGGTDDPCLSRV